MINPDEVPKDPYPLIDGFEWVTMDLTKDAQVGHASDIRIVVLIAS